MRSISFAVALVAVVAGAASSARAGETKAGKPPAAGTRAAKPAIEWATSFPDAMEEAKERNVPIFLHSHANTCPPCKAIHKAVFEDPDYVRWANDGTIHVLSYDVHADADPEPLVEVDRGGTKASVYAAYPMFTPEEMTLLLAEIGKRVDFPLHTPWAGVISPDGKRVLAEVVQGGPKDFRAAYEAGQRLLGTPFPRAAWKKIKAALRASTDAEYDSRWKEAVASALEARSLGKAAPGPLEEAIDARVASVTAEGKRLLAEAKKSKDAKAEAKVREDFAGLALD